VVRTVVLALAVALVALALAPASGWAHAQLGGTEPANETTTDSHPDEVSLTFSEDVTAPFGAVRVYGPDGSRVESGSVRVDGHDVRVPIDSQEPGTYAVAWRVTSADGHPVHGAFVFHVEHSSADRVSRDKALAASKDHRGYDIAFGVARFGILLGVLGAVGGILFAVLAAGSWRPRWLRTSMLVALVSLAAAYVLDAAIAAGVSIGEALDGEILREQASAVYGRATLVRIGVLVVCALASLLVRTSRWQRPVVRWVVLVPFVALAATLSLSGHAVGDDVSVLRLPFDMLHAVAAAAWIGGLVQLVPWSRATPVDAAVLERWSRTAMTCVAVLVVTGAWAAYEEVGLSLDALVQTRYGYLVIAKVALLVATMPLANLNRVRTVPAVRAGSADAPARLRSYVRAEVGLLVLVLAVTAWLVQAPPAKVALQPGLFDTTVQLAGGGSVQLVIDPARAGSNEIHAYAFDPQQQVDPDVTDMTLTATNKQRGVGPLELQLDETGPGHYQIPAGTIPFDGKWSFELGVRHGRFDEQLARFTADIAPTE
jgi:copper transport protein